MMARLIELGWAAACGLAVVYVAAIILFGGQP
ncbi:hypothetical protein ABIE28_002748 [Devosia sp. 2618]